MRLDDFLDELFAVLEDADIGLNVPDGQGVHAGPPAPYVQLPEVMYGESGPGLDRIPDLGLTVIFGQASNSAVFKLALQYASSGGTTSLKVLLEQHAWTSCGTVFVRSAEPSTEIDRGGNPALAYTFHIDITGRPG